MRKEYKQLIIAYLSYVLGFWGISSFAILYSSSPRAIALVVGTFFLAFFIGVPFYIWIAIREAMLKERLNTQNLYKHSFVAGLLIPPVYFITIWVVMSISLRDETLLIIIPLIFIIGFAESCVRLNKIKSYQKNSTEGVPPQI